MAILYIRKKDSQVPYALSDRVKEFILDENNLPLPEFENIILLGITMIISEVKIDELPQHLANSIMYSKEQGTPVLVTLDDIKSTTDTTKSNDAIYNRDLCNILAKYSKENNDRISKLTTNKSMIIHFRQITLQLHRSMSEHDTRDINSLQVVDTIQNNLMGTYLSKDIVSNVMIDVIIPRYIEISEIQWVYNNVGLSVTKLKALSIHSNIRSNDPLYTQIKRAINIMTSMVNSPKDEVWSNYTKLTVEVIPSILTKLSAYKADSISLLLNIIGNIMSPKLPDDAAMIWVKTLDHKFQSDIIKGINDIRSEMGYDLLIDNNTSNIEDTVNMDRDNQIQLEYRRFLASISIPINIMYPQHTKKYFPSYMVNIMERIYSTNIKEQVELPIQMILDLQPVLRSIPESNDLCVNTIIPYYTTIIGILDDSTTGGLSTISKLRISLVNVLYHMLYSRPLLIPYYFKEGVINQVISTITSILTCDTFNDNDLVNTRISLCIINSRLNHDPDRYEELTPLVESISHTLSVYGVEKQ